MWSPLADRPPRSVAPAATSSGHQSARFGGTCTPTPGRSSRAVRTSARMSSIVTGEDHAGAGTAGPPGRPGRPDAPAGSGAVGAGAPPEDPRGGPAGLGG